MAFADPYTCYITTCYVSLSKVSLNLAASIVVPQEKVKISSTDIEAVNFSLGIIAFLPLDTCAPHHCQSCQYFPILILLDLLFLDLFFSGFSNLAGLAFLLLFLDLLLLDLFLLDLLSCWTCLSILLIRLTLLPNNVDETSFPCVLKY